MARFSARARRTGTGSLPRIRYARRQLDGRRDADYFNKTSFAVAVSLPAVARTK